MRLRLANLKLHPYFEAAYVGCGSSAIVDGLLDEEGTGKQHLVFL